MIQIRDFYNQLVEIIEFQTTFIIIKVENKLYRFNFKNKKEAFLNQKEIGILQFYEKHPLLINHNESSHDVFINSKPDNVLIFVEDIKNTINEIIDCCRNWKDYIEFNTGIDYQTFLQNIQKGSGKIFELPFSIIKKIETVCEKHHVKISYFGENRIFNNQLVLINNQFIIIEQFRYILM